MKIIRNKSRKMTRKGTWTNQMQIKTPDWARTENFHCKKYNRENDCFGNLEDVANSYSWDLLYKLLRSKERQKKKKKKVIAARLLYIYFPYGEISKNFLKVYNKGKITCRPQLNGPAESQQRIAWRVNLEKSDQGMLVCGAVKAALGSQRDPCLRFSKTLNPK